MEFVRIQTSKMSTDIEPQSSLYCGVIVERKMTVIWPQLWYRPFRVYPKLLRTGWRQATAVTRRVGGSRWWRESDHSSYDEEEETGDETKDEEETKDDEEEEMMESEEYESEWG